LTHQVNSVSSSIISVLKPQTYVAGVFLNEQLHSLAMVLFWRSPKLEKVRFEGYATMTRAIYIEAIEFYTDAVKETFRQIRIIENAVI
jgi:hypothetical protein